MATKEELNAAKRDLELQRLRRQTKLESWEAHFQFIAGKIVGVISAVEGGLELIDPSIIPYDTPKPHWVLAVGLGLLTGKSIIKLIHTITSTIK